MKKKSNVCFVNADLDKLANFTKQDNKNNILNISSRANNTVRSLSFINSNSNFQNRKENIQFSKPDINRSNSSVSLNLKSDSNQELNNKMNNSLNYSRFRESFSSMNFNTSKNEQLEDLSISCINTMNSNIRNSVNTIKFKRFTNIYNEKKEENNILNNLRDLDGSDYDVDTDENVGSKNLTPLFKYNKNELNSHNDKISFHNILTNFYKIDDPKLFYLEKELNEFRKISDKLKDQKEMINHLKKEKEIIHKGSISECKEVELKNEKDIIKEIENLKKRFEERSNRYKNMVGRLKNIINTKKNENNSFSREI